MCKLVFSQNYCPEVRACYAYLMYIMKSTKKVLKNDLQNVNESSRNKKIYAKIGLISDEYIFAIFDCTCLVTIVISYLNPNPLTTLLRTLKH